MIRNKEIILQEKTDKLYEYVKEYINDLDNLSDTSDFTIDNIEKKWGSLENTAKQVLREINEDIISQINEKALIKSKKKNIPNME
jgi:DNA replication initiation complex subunit (GINS family)